jgi:opacity protein-like surface antigen
MKILPRILLGCALLSVFELPARSEPLAWDISVSGFGGMALPFSTKTKITDPTLPADLTVNGVRLDSSTSFGGKVSAWRRRQALDFVDLGVHPDLGIELDVTRFSPNVRTQTGEASGVIAGSLVTQASPIKLGIDVTIIAVNLLARFPMGLRDDLPNGRWYPYLGMGAGAAISRAKTTTGEQDTSTEPAFQVLGGLKYFLGRHVGIFAEYKFTHASHAFTLATTRQEMIVNTSHVVVGIAAHY